MTSRKVMLVLPRSIATTSAACSRMLTRGACRWVNPTPGIAFGVSTSSASLANSSSDIFQTSSGFCSLNLSSTRTSLAERVDSSANASLNQAEMSLNARYCKSRANSRSRASSIATSSGLTNSPLGSSPAIFRSSSVAATTKNSLACSSSS